MEGAACKLVITAAKPNVNMTYSVSGTKVTLKVLTTGVNNIYIPEGKIKEHLQIARTFLSPTLSPEANEQYQKLREIFPNGRVDYHSYMHKDDNTIDQGWMSEIYTVLSEGKTMSK